jgi:soluble cytochrome b562
LAAKEINALWDRSMEDLSQSYERTLGLLDSKKKKEARLEFHDHFLVTVKRLYSEMATTSPEKFAKAKDWRKWARDLYTLTVKTHQALQTGSIKEAGVQLGRLRELFYTLHEESDTRLSNDFIYIFHKEAETREPSPARLKEIRGALEKSAPSRKAAAEALTFQKARAQWASQVDQALKDGEVSPSRIRGLRKAALDFYRSFGIQFE